MSETTGGDRDGQWRKREHRSCIRNSSVQLTARRLCVWARSARGSRGSLAKSLPVAPPWLCCLFPARCCGRCRSNHPHNPAPDELYSTDHHNVADGLTTLPQDYAGIARNIPQLGPPLPGDLGRPIVTAEGQSAPIGLDAEQQRANQETEAARTSKYLRRQRRPLRHHMPHPRKRRPRLRHLQMKPSLRTGRISKLLFVNAPVDRRTTAPDRLSRPASPFVVQAGTIIPAALITGIRSDLPGQITAQVTEDGLRYSDRPRQTRPAGSTTDRRL